jgi:hypothetical protein
MAAARKSLEVRIADLVRLLGSESEGEVLATHGALKRLLASHGVSFTDLGNGIERLATGGLEQAETLVIDADNDKGKGGVVSICPSLVVETVEGELSLLALLQPARLSQARDPHFASFP